MTENKGNKPIMKLRNGQIVATVWENKKDVNGKEVKFQSVVIEKSYTVGEGNNQEWKSTHNLSKTDISKAITLLQRLDNDLNVSLQ